MARTLLVADPVQLGPPDPLDPLETPEPPDSLEPLDSLDPTDSPEPPETLDRTDLRDLPETTATMVSPEPLDRTDSLERPDPKETEEVATTALPPEPPLDTKSEQSEFLREILLFVHRFDLSNKLCVSKNVLKKCFVQ